jgi:hypothetical protein
VDSGVGGQLRLFGGVVDPVVERLVERLEGIDVNTMTPLQALALLEELSREARERRESGHGPAADRV